MGLILLVLCLNELLLGLLHTIRHVCALHPLWCLQDVHHFAAAVASRAPHALHLARGGRAGVVADDEVHLCSQCGQMGNVGQKF